MFRYIRYYCSIIAHKYWVAYYLLCFIGTLIIHRIVYAFDDPLDGLPSELMEKLSLYDITLLFTENDSAALIKASNSYANQIFKLYLNTPSISFFKFILKLFKRALTHDLSKFLPSEGRGFSSLTYKLKGVEFGTPAYREMLKELRPTVTLHYKRNTHHPEYYGNRNILGMDLFDFIEMFYDWKAAGKRNKNGDISKSILIQQAKLNLETITVSILFNTI